MRRFAMVQAIMKLVPALAFFLAASVLTVRVNAQQAAPPAQVAERLAPATFASATPRTADSASLTTATSQSVAPATQNALLRAATPQLAPEHKFFDRQQFVALYVHAGVRTADTIETCHRLANGAVEVWIPTQSCAGVAAWQAGSVGAALGIGWIFHKTGHHKLERITPWVGTGASSAGLTKSVFNIH